MRKFFTRGRGRTLRRRAAVALAVAMTFSLAACGGDDGGETTEGGLTPVKVGSIAILDVAPLYLGIERGFFEDEGLDVTVESLQGGADIIPGVAGGDFQFGLSNTMSMIVAAAQGIPLRGLASCSNATMDPEKDFGAIIIPEDSDIKRPRDLEGKKVAVNTLKNINEATVAETVKRDGGDPSKVDFVELAFPDIVPALEKGDIAAGQVVEPFLTIGQQSGMKQLASNLAGLQPNLAVSLYFTSEQYEAENPDVVEGFTSAMNKSLEYATGNPDEARRILSTFTEITPGVQDAVTLPGWPTEIDTKGVELMSQLAVDYGYVEEEPDLSTLLPQ